MKFAEFFCDVTGQACRLVHHQLATPCECRACREWRELFEREPEEAFR